MTVAFGTDYSELMKMVSTPTEWPAFAIQLDEFVRIKKVLTYFFISLISCTPNSKADMLAKSARLYLYNVTYVKSLPPIWISKPL